MSQIFSHVCSKKKSSLLRFNGESDHVYLLVSIAPSTQISDLVCCLKSASSRILRQEFATTINEFYASTSLSTSRKPVLWSPSYCVVSAGGASLEVLRKYIDGQDSPEDPEEQEEAGKLSPPSTQ